VGAEKKNVRTGPTQTCKTSSRTIGVIKIKETKASQEAKAPHRTSTKWVNGFTPHESGKNCRYFLKKGKKGPLKWLG